MNECRMPTMRIKERDGILELGLDEGSVGKKRM